MTWEPYWSFKWYLLPQIHKYSCINACDFFQNFEIESQQYRIVIRFLFKVFSENETSREMSLMLMDIRYIFKDSRNLSY